MGTFLECTNFIYENFDLINIFISSLSSDYKTVKELILNRKFIEKLKIGSDSIFIWQTIKHLETGGLSLADQIEILSFVRNKVFDENILKRFDDIIVKNVDLSFFLNIRLREKH